MKKFLPTKQLLLAAIILIGANFATAQDQITFTNNVGALPTYNPDALALGDADVTITSTLNRDIVASYKNAAATPYQNKDVLLASTALGNMLGKSTGTTEFDLPAGVGTLEYTIDKTDASLIEPVVYVNGVKKTMTSGTPLTIDETGVVGIKFANESSDATKAVIILKVNWTDYSATAIDNITAPKVNIFPNPVTSILNFNSVTDIQSVNIYDLAGRTIKSYNNLAVRIIDLSDLENGLYLVSFSTVDGLTSTQKILKK